MTEPALFDVPAPAAELVRATRAPDATPGERRRARQALAIAHGEHPLSAVARAPIRLHPDAERVTADDGGRELRCGSCAHRQSLGGHARAYPKCLVDYERVPLDAPTRSGATHRVTFGPRVTQGEASDVRAWWPACTEFQARD